MIDVYLKRYWYLTYYKILSVYKKTLSYFLFISNHSLQIIRRTNKRQVTRTVMYSKHLKYRIKKVTRTKPLARRYKYHYEVNIIIYHQVIYYMRLKQ